MTVETLYYQKESVNDRLLNLYYKYKKTLKPIYLDAISGLTKELTALEKHIQVLEKQL